MSLAALFLIQVFILSCSPGSTLTNRKRIPPGGIRVTRYPQNTMCFKLETSGGIVVITDPYKMNETVSPDIVTVSHDHYDHSDFSELSGSYVTIDRTGEYAFNGLTITGVGGVHDKRHSYESMRMFRFDFGPVRIAHFGDQGDVPGEEAFEKIGKVDIVILQYVARDNAATLTLDEAAEIVERTGAMIVIPAHGDHRQDALLAKRLGADHDARSETVFVVAPDDLAGMKRRRVLTLFTDRL